MTTQSRLSLDRTLVPAEAATMIHGGAFSSFCTSFLRSTSAKTKYGKMVSTLLPQAKKRLNGQLHKLNQ
jgi:hypothetical protein